MQELNVGTHTVFVGEIQDGAILKDGEPMTYIYYQQVKRGTTPQTAPTYIDKKKEEKGMKKYRCKICGYVYDPALGDPDAGVPANTPYEKLPEDWVCPICGAGKDQFEPE